MKSVYFLATPIARANAVQGIKTAPDGYKVTVQPPKRSLDANAKFHAICGDLEKLKIKFAGTERPAWQWKVILISGHSAATKEAVNVTAGIEDEIVVLRESSAEMSKERMGSLIEYSQAFLEMHK